MRSRTPSLRYITRVFTLIAAAMLLPACASTLNAEDLNTQISEELTSEFEMDVTVECPDDVKPEEGGTFTCTARDEAGNSLPVQITQTDDQGNVDWSMKAFDPSAIEDQLEPEVSDSVGAEITIECPRELISSRAGSSMDCSATDDAGGEGLLRVTAVDDQGNVDWELNP